MKTIKKTGKVQSVFLTDGVKKERNTVHSFNGRISLVRVLWNVYKSGCDKAYIFFDKNKNETT